MSIQNTIAGYQGYCYKKGYTPLREDTVEALYSEYGQELVLVKLVKHHRAAMADLNNIALVSDSSKSFSDFFRL